MRSRVQRKKRFSGLGANVEVEVSFEGDVVAVLLCVHDRPLATRQTERVR